MSGKAILVLKKINCYVISTGNPSLVLCSLLILSILKILMFTKITDLETTYRSNLIALLLCLPSSAEVSDLISSSVLQLDREGLWL